MLIANFLYELPFLKGNNHAAGKLLGGWQLSGLIQYQSGTPTNIGKLPTTPALDLTAV